MQIDKQSEVYTDVIADLQKDKVLFNVLKHEMPKHFESKNAIRADVARVIFGVMEGRAKEAIDMLENDILVTEDGYTIQEALEAVNNQRSAIGETWAHAVCEQAVYDGFSEEQLMAATHHLIDLVNVCWCSKSNQT